MCQPRIQNTISVMIAISVAVWANCPNAAIVFHFARKTQFGQLKTSPLPLFCHAAFSMVLTKLHHLLSNNICQCIWDYEPNKNNLFVITMVSALGLCIHVTHTPILVGWEPNKRKLYVRVLHHIVSGLQFLML